LFIYLASSVDLYLEKPVPYQRKSGQREGERRREVKCQLNEDKMKREDIKLTKLSHMKSIIKRN